MRPFFLFVFFFVYDLKILNTAKRCQICKHSPFKWFFQKIILHFYYYLCNFVLPVQETFHFLFLLNYMKIHAVLNSSYECSGLGSDVFICQKLMFYFSFAVFFFLYPLSAHYILSNTLYKYLCVDFSDETEGVSWNWEGGDALFILGIVFFFFKVPRPTMKV